MADAAADIATCNACKEVMLDVDGQPRPKARTAHCCSSCKECLHAPMVCKVACSLTTPSKRLRDSRCRFDIGKMTEILPIR
eukprot:1897572-Pleurochrysis_carterae.AAC.1